MSQKIALLLGNGRYAQYLHAELYLNKKVDCFFSINGKSTSDFHDADFYLERFKLSKLLAALESRDISQVILGGNFRFTSSKFFHAFSSRDPITKKLIAQSVKNYFSGNIASFLNGFRDELAKIGVAAIPANSLLPELSLSNTIDSLAGLETHEISRLNKLAESSQRIIDTSIEKYIIQTLVFDEEERVLTEKKQGTDSLLRKLTKSKKEDRTRTVIKLSPSTFDYSFDPPVLGTKTIDLAAKAQVDVIIVDENKGIIFEQEKVLKLCNESNIRLIGRDFLRNYKGR